MHTTLTLVFWGIGPEVQKSLLYIPLEHSSSAWVEQRPLDKRSPIPVERQTRGIWVAGVEINMINIDHMKTTVIDIFVKEALAVIETI